MVSPMIKCVQYTTNNGVSDLNLGSSREARPTLSKISLTGHDGEWPNLRLKKKQPSSAICPTCRSPLAPPATPLRLGPPEVLIDGDIKPRLIPQQYDLPLPIRGLSLSLSSSSRLSLPHPFRSYSEHHLPKISLKPHVTAINFPKRRSSFSGKSLDSTRKPLPK